MYLEYDGAHDGKNPLSPNGEPVMTIRTFLTELQQRGVTLTPTPPDSVTVRGASKLSAAEIERIRNHKPEIIAVLTAAHEPEPTRFWTPRIVQCQACAHAGPYPHNPTNMVACAQGWGWVNPLNARWKTDWIQCPDYSEQEVQQGGRRQ